MDAFGVDHARNIRHGSEAALWALELSDDDVDESSQAISIQGQSYRIVDRDEITDRRGMEHLRHALIQDSSYRWGVSNEDKNRAKRWRTVICFRNGDNETQVALDLVGGRLMLLPNGPLLDCTPCVSGLRVVLNDESITDHD